jgi:hypothetical protein
LERQGSKPFIKSLPLILLFCGSSRAVRDLLFYRRMTS